MTALLRVCYEAAVAAADPARVVQEGLQAHAHALASGRDRPHWILATGKAAPRMASAAVAHCVADGRALAGGLVVGAAGTLPGAPPAHAAVTTLVGDHPVPGVRSAAAAEAIASLTERVQPGDVVLVLLSGGTSSLIGAPIGGVRASDLAALHALLLGAGMPIARMNAVRKRFARWGAGRLAEALHGCVVVPIVLSDVPGDDPAMVGSGPLSPDPHDAADVERMLREAGVAAQTPLTVAATLGAMRAGQVPETPKPGHVAFDRVEAPYIVGNRRALEAAAIVARGPTVSRVHVAPSHLEGDAVAAGRVIAHAMARAPRRTLAVWGGETTVRLPADHGLGGRCQQLALAAAETLDDLGVSGISLLAAGTDGHDGPAPACGAVVTDRTWAAIRAAGAEPRAALRRCDAYGALQAAGAILAPWETGTNVMDIVVAVRA